MAGKKKRQTKKKKEENKIITYIASFGVILLLSVAMFKFGAIGKYANLGLRFLFGEYYYSICILGIITAGIFIFDKQSHRKMNLIVALISVISAIVLWSAVLGNDGLIGGNVLKNFLAPGAAHFNPSQLVAVQGGLIGALLYSMTSLLIGSEGTWILIGCLVVLSLVLTIRLEFFKDAWHGIKNLFAELKEEIQAFEPEEAEEAEEAEEVWEEMETYDEDESFEPFRQQEESVIKSFEKNKKESIFLDIEDIGYQGAKEHEESDNQESATRNAVSFDGDKNEETNENIGSEILPKIPNKPYRLPPLSLLDATKGNVKSGANATAAKEKGQDLIRILGNFGIPAELIGTHIGPAITKFEIKPDATVKVNKINGLADNIKMELAAKDIRIEAPIPGKNAVGIEIPNVESTAVRMNSLIKEIPEKLKDKKTIIALGKDLLGEPIFCDLQKMPHLLIAGATGSGKSVCMNTVITSLIMRAKPSEVQLMLIDPKKVEFTPFKKIPHLICPVITEAEKAIKALHAITEIMDERYDVFAKAGVRNIEGFNQKVIDFPQENIQPLPYIIVIIDELADLMSVAGKDLDKDYQRIAQLARAAGIHLVIATQRPSIDVITGVIKANIPSRIAFSVSSSIDSRTILGEMGAERLLGNGDMLYYPIGAAAPIRLQGVYISDEEVANITSFLEKQAIPQYNDKLIGLEGVQGNTGTAIVEAEDDPLYEEIKDYVIEVQKASTSLLQRRFGVGYNRGARMIDLLEEQGVIGPARGSKPREVYMKKDKASE